MNITASYMTSDGKFRPVFYCTKVGDILSNVTVNMSRRGDSCPTPVQDLQAHNSHAPTFSSLEEMNAYSKRVQEDVFLVILSAQPDTIFIIEKDEPATLALTPPAPLTGAMKFGLPDGTPVHPNPTHGVKCLVCNNVWEMHYGWTCLSWPMAGTP